MSVLEQSNSRAARELKSVRAFMFLHWDLTKRYLPWDIMWLVSDLAGAIVIGLIGVSSAAQPDFLPPGQSFIAYLLIGAVMWSFLSVIFYIIAETISMERWEGTLEYTFMAPVSRFTHLGGVAFVGLIYTIVRTLIITVALYFAFEITLTNTNFLTAAVVLLVGSLATIGLSVLTATLPLLSPEKGPQAIHIVSSIILLASGVYYPVEILPDWLQPLVQVNPLYWSLIGLRQALLEGYSVAQVAPVLGRLALSGMLFLPIGFFAFYLAEKYAKRTGLLKRSG
ncbi:MAG: ABC transporter permease [bacterium]|nr:ABC transporter permease [bacterium]